MRDASATAWCFAPILGWSSASLWYALNLGDPGLALLVGFAVLSTLVATLRDATLGVILLPFPVLMGPILPVYANGLGMLTAADLQLLTLAVAFLFVDRRLFEPIFFGPARHVLAALITSLVLSWVLSQDIRVSTYALANIAELFVVYLLTLNLIKRLEDVRRLLDGWILATTLSALLVLYHYLQGEPLLLSSDILATVPTLDAAAMAGIFFRATHFYVGFFFIVGAVIVLIAADFLDSPVSTPSRRYALVPAGAICVLTLLLMNTKSALYSAVLITGAILLREWLWKLGVRTQARGRKKVWAGLALTLFAAITVIPLILAAEQIDAFTERLASMESLEQRFVIYSNALTEVLSDTKVLLFGVGPDTLIRARDLAVISRILTDPRGVTEGALDSTFLTIIVEFGFVFALFSFIFVFVTLRFLYLRRFAFPRGIYLGLFGALGAWLLTAGAQHIGWSKTSWFLLQLIAVAHLAAGSRFVKVPSVRTASSDRGRGAAPSGNPFS